MTTIGILAWVSSLLFLGVVVVGIAVVVQAFRADRRTDDPTMRYFAIGLGLVLVVAPIVGIGREMGHESLMSVGPTVTMGALVFEQGLKLLGVSAIAYALYGKRRL